MSARSSGCAENAVSIETPTLVEFVDLYLGQHGGEPETIDKLRWLLAKAVQVFGERRLGQLRSPEIAAWRMKIPAGHRFVGGRLRA